MGPVRSQRRGSRGFLFVALAAGALAIAGCSGPQSGDGDGCPRITERMGAGEMTNGLACWAARPAEEGAPVCREALAMALSMPPDALEVAVGCTLAANERTDGPLIAELMHTVREDADRVRAASNGLAFLNRDIHGNGFAVALSRAAQTAMGDQLAGLTEEAQQVVVAVALGYSLNPLMSYCGPYVQSLDEDDPALSSYARSIDTSQDLDEGERWALAVSGEWSGADILDCFDGEGGCDGWDGQSPLELLEHAEEVGEANAPSRAVDLLRNEDLGEAADAVAHFVSSADYPMRGNYINTLMNDMTNPDRPETNRRAIAMGATGRMCSFEQMRQYFRRAVSTYEDGLDNPDTIWAQYVLTCLEEWDEETMIQALASGSWLMVPQSIRDEIRGRLSLAMEGGSCDDYLELADASLDIIGQVWMAGIGVVEAARLAGDSCASEFTQMIMDAASDSGAHPEGRLAGVEWLLEQGDDSGCGEISDAMGWSNEELRLGPSEWAEQQAEALRAQCP